MSFDAPDLLPVDVLNDYSRAYSGIWKRLEEARGRAEVDGWCWLPQGVAAAVRHSFFKNVPPVLGQDKYQDSAMITALATWRLSQGIYRFHPEIAQNVLDTSLAGGKLPVEAFFKMPEFCMYIETPPWLDLEKPGALFGTHGFWVRLDREQNRGVALQFVLIRYEFGSRNFGTNYDFSVFDLPFSPGMTLEESLDSVFVRVRESLKDNPDPDVVRNMELMAQEEYRKFVEAQFQEMINLTLFLCANDPDVTGGAPEKATPTKTKKGPRWFPAQKPVVREVGARVVKWIREARERASGAGGAGQSGRSVIPHMRKAHWHGYWTGPRKDPEARNFELKWIPPTMVGFKEGEAVGAPTIKIVDNPA